VRKIVPGREIRTAWRPEPPRTLTSPGRRGKLDGEHVAHVAPARSGAGSVG